MQVSVNGKNEETIKQTLAEFLIARSLLERRVAVECNGHIILKSEYKKFILNDGDILEIVHAIGGG